MSVKGICTVYHADGRSEEMTDEQYARFLADQATAATEESVEDIESPEGAIEPDSEEIPDALVTAAAPVVVSE